MLWIRRDILYGPLRDARVDTLFRFMKAFETCRLLLSQPHQLQTLHGRRALKQLGSGPSYGGSMFLKQNPGTRGVESADLVGPLTDHQFMANTHRESRRGM